jgi:hypothetical protein
VHDADDGGEVGPQDLPAGNFSSWLSDLQVAVGGERSSDVPCGGCTACCTSSQFVHVGPDEVDALAHIPGELLFPAPGMPRGHVLVGYAARGHCPMLVDGRCSIYEYRPRTCRTYDCRVFPAAGVEPDEDGKAEIAHRARRWRFSHPTARDQVEHEAVRAAAAFLQDAGRDLLPGLAPASATQLAVLAIEVHDAFLADDGDGTAPQVVAHPDVEDVRMLLEQRSPRAPGSEGGRRR